MSLDGTLNSMINANTGQINLGNIGGINMIQMPTMTVLGNGTVLATDPQNAEDINNKIRAKKEMSSSIPFDFTSILLESIGEEGALKEAIKGFEITNSKIKQTRQNIGNQNNEYMLSPNTFAELWGQYNTVANLLASNNRLGNLALLGRILTNLFRNKAVLDNLTGAGYISLEDAGIIAQTVNDQQIPLDFLTMLNLCFYQISSNMLKATAYEANLVSSPDALVSDLIDAITKNNNKNDIMRQQLFVLSNHGVIDKNNSSQYMVNQTMQDEASIIKMLAQKPIQLWSPEDYKYEAQVLAYMTTGQLPTQQPGTLPLGNPQGGNLPVGAMIFSPTNGMQVATPNGLVGGAEALQFVNNFGGPQISNTGVAGNGVIVNKTGNNENLSSNLITPNPQARQMFNNQMQNQTIISGTSGLTAGVQPGVMQGVAPNNGFMPTVGNNVVYANQMYTQPTQPLQPNLNNMYTQPYNQNMGVQNTQQFVNQPVIQPMNQLNIQQPMMTAPLGGLNNQQFTIMPNNDFDKNVPDQAILYWRVSEYGNQIEPVTQSKILRLEDPVGGEIKLVTTAYYNHRRQYLTNMAYKMSYDTFITNSGGMIQNPNLVNNQSNLGGLIPPYNPYVTTQPTQQMTQGQPNLYPTYNTNMNYGTTNQFGFMSNDPLAHLSTAGNQQIGVNQNVGFPLAIPGFM